MYCVKCGVQLADTEKSCPLCGTRVYHPDLVQAETTPLYPNTNTPPKKIKRWSVILILTILYLLPMSICLVCDLAVSGTVIWSGYVIGGMLIFYAACILPNWFEKPNPVIFTPIVFGVIALFLLYACYATGGSWFWTLALPITVTVALIVCTAVTLCRYILRGRLYIYGSVIVAFGLLAVLLEFLLTITFPMPPMFTWSLYPLLSLGLLGAAVLATAIFKPIRESLEKKFFL